MNLSRLNAHTRATFLSNPSIKEIPVTTRIIDAVFPYYPKDCKCISGYLNSADQFWKVNYHWDSLVYRIDLLLKMPAVPENLKNCARAIRGALMRNPPMPLTGYRNDKTVGATKDMSSPDKVIARHAILKQSKKDFETVIVKAAIVKVATKSNPPTAEKPWWLCVAPVAIPGNSNHGTGYALDIAGNNAETTRVSNALGASLVFNEASHVHVEWARGVMIDGRNVTG